MLKECPCWPPMQPPAFVKVALKKLLYLNVVGISGVFRDKVTKKINKLSLLELVIGNFNSLLSQENSLFFMSLDGPSRWLNAVNCAGCHALHA